MANNPRHLRPPLTSIYTFLDYYADQKKKKGEPVFCFQVGANDGKTNDPVHKYFTNFNWNGLLVEPQKDVFDLGLSKTYEGNPRVKIENVALGKEEGSLPFYRVAISKARWATGLSSFDKTSLEEHIKNGYIIRKAQEEGVEIPQDQSKILETVLVPTLKVQTLFHKHNIKKLDVLCVDTEGYDFEILKLIDFKTYSPEVVLFESKNLSNEDFVASKKLLTDHGYTLFWEKGDTLGVKASYPFPVKCIHKVKAFLRKL
jgi:FkbM family methyltransferase